MFVMLATLETPYASILIYHVTLEHFTFGVLSHALLLLCGQLEGCFKYLYQLLMVLF